jgi:hypothetical protein
MNPTTRLALKFAVLATALLIAASIGDRLLAGRLRWSDPETDAVMEEVGRQGFKDQLNARLKGVTRTEAAQVGMDLARRGIARLSPDHLAERADLLLYLDTHATDSVCAARFIGTLPPSTYKSYLSAFDSGQRARWRVLSVAAMKAELLATEPLPSVQAEQVQELFARILAATASPDHDRLQALLTDLLHAGVADQCWASRTVTRTTLGMAEPDRTRTLRAMARIEAGN